MGSNEEYEHKNFWQEPIQADFWYNLKDIHLNAPPNEQVLTLVLSERMYDMAKKMYGENCGYSKRVKVIRGYHKFEDNNK